MDLLLTGNHFYYIVSTDCQENNVISTKLEDLPNEIITKVLSYLEIRDRIYFGHLSKRTRAVRCNKTLWQKVSIHSEHLKSEFLQFMVSNGCKCLKLILVWVKGSLHLRKTLRLQELFFENCEMYVLIVG